MLCNLVPAPIEAEDAEEADDNEDDTEAGRPMHNPTIAEVEDFAKRMLMLSMEVEALGEAYQ